jgi:hypothetical protein
MLMTKMLKLQEWKEMWEKEQKKIRYESDRGNAEEDYVIKIRNKSSLFGFKLTFSTNCSSCNRNFQK